MASEPFSPIEVEVEIRDTIEKLDDAVTHLASSSQIAARKAHAYRQAQASAWAKARLDSTLTTDKARSAWVDQETSEEMLDRNLAEAEFEGNKALVRSLQTRADLLRSLARSSRDLVDSWHGGG